MSSEPNTEHHPFDEPCHFGEDGEWIVVCGDISAAEAAKRMTEFEKQCGAENVEIKKKEISLMKAYKSCAADGCEEYTLMHWNQVVPDGIERIWDVWSFDNY